MNSIQRFFSELSERFRKENDLSDITWVMCQSCPLFKDLFLKFFFKDIPIELIVSITREKVDKNEKDSRVDLLISIRGNKPYLIEIKIGDRNHHFAQYTKAYKVEPNRLGYITNYPMNENEEPLSDKSGNLIGYQWREWKSFYSYLKNEIVNLEDQSEKDCIEGYLSYLQSVCGIINLEKPMNFSGIYSLYELLVIIKEIISNSTNSDYSLTFFEGRYDKEFVQHKMAFKLEYKKQKLWEGTDAEIYGWISLYCDSEEPTLYIYFDNAKKWGKPVYDLLHEYHQKNALKGGKLFLKPTEEEHTFFFCFSNQEDTSKFNESFAALSLGEQKKMLQDFVDEVFVYIYSIIKKKENEIYV